MFPIGVTYMEYILTLDNKVIRFINKNMRSPLLDKIMRFVSRLGNGGFIWITLAVSLILMGGERKKMGWLMLGSLGIESAACNLVIKPVVGRVRPFDEHNMEITINKPKDYSFPSGHTAASFAAAVSYYLSDKKHGKAAIAGAIAMGFSRIYLLVHYPTDVICGAALGIVSALSVHKIYKKKSSK